MRKHRTSWYCAYCGHANPDESSLCSCCGNPRRESPAAVPSPSAPAPERGRVQPKPAPAPAVTPAVTFPGKKSKKKYILGGVAILCILLLSAAGFFFFHSMGTTAGDYNAVAETLEISVDNRRDFQERNFEGEPVRTVFTVDGVETESLLYTRDEKGRVTCVEHFADGKRVGHVDTVYEGCECCRKYYADDESEPYDKEYFKINRHGDIVRYGLITVVGPEDRIKYKYDLKGRITERVELDDKDGKPFEIETYKYSDGGSTVFYTREYRRGIDTCCYYYYDEDGKLTGEKRLDPEAWSQGEEKVEMEAEYTYDEYGNIDILKFREGDGPFMTTIYHSTPFGHLYLQEHFENRHMKGRTLYKNNIWGEPELLVRDYISYRFITENTYDCNGQLTESKQLDTP